MSLNIKNILEMIVPQFALIALFSPISAYMILNKSLPEFNFIWIIISFSLAIFGFNVINMVADKKLDAIDKPLRAIPSNKVSTNDAMILSFIFYASSLLIGFFINSNTLFVLLFFIFLTILYSSPWGYMKKFWWASSIFGMLLYGLVPMLLAYSISGFKPIQYEFVLLFLGLFFFISNIKDFEDIVAEGKMKVNSLPLLVGNNAALNFILIGEFIVILLMVIFVYVGTIKFNYIYAAIISFIFYLVFMVLLIKDVKKIEYKNIVFNEFNNKEIRDIITQSDAVTYAILLVLLIQLTFGFFSII